MATAQPQKRPPPAIPKPSRLPLNSEQARISSEAPMPKVRPEAGPKAGPDRTGGQIWTWGAGGEVTATPFGPFFFILPLLWGSPFLPLPLQKIPLQRFPLSLHLLALICPLSRYPTGSMPSPLPSGASFLSTRPLFLSYLTLLPCPTPCSPPTDSPLPLLWSLSHSPPKHSPYSGLFTHPLQLSPAPPPSALVISSPPTNNSYHGMLIIINNILSSVFPTPTPVHGQKMVQLSLYTSASLPRSGHCTVPPTHTHTLFPPSLPINSPDNPTHSFSSSCHYATCVY